MNNIKQEEVQFKKLIHQAIFNYSSFKIFKWKENGKMKVITILNDNYLKLLKESHKPPFAIYYEFKDNKLNKNQTIKFINGKMFE